jgi:hypothetical protein
VKKRNVYNAEFYFLLQVEKERARNYSGGSIRKNKA